MRKKLLCFVFFMLFCVIGSCLAAADFTVSEVSYDSSGRELRFLISDSRAAGQSPNKAAAFIDGTELSEVTIKSFSDSDASAVFVFVVDTTETSYADQKKRPAEIADAIRSVRGTKNDSYYLISYDSVVHDPVGPSADPSEVLDNLNYENSGLSDYSAALLKAVDLLDGEKSFKKKVIILIGDAYQTRRPKMDQSELLKKLSDAGYPVYSCGLRQAQSGRYEREALKYFGEISERTGGLFFTYETNTKPGDEIVDHVGKSLVVQGKFPKDYSRESTEPADLRVRLYRGSNEIANVSRKVNLPSISVQKTAEPVPAATATAVPAVSESAETSAENKSWLERNLGKYWLFALISLALLAALGVYLLVKWLRGNNSGSKSGSGRKAGNGRSKKRSWLEKIFGFSKNYKKRFEILIEDIKTGKSAHVTIHDGEKRVFGRQDRKNRLSDVVVITYNDDCVSRSQFMITAEEGNLYLKDLGSINSTYLNGEKVSGETLIFSGSRIRVGDKIGEHEFSFTVVNAR